MATKRKARKELKVGEEAEDRCEEVASNRIVDRDKYAKDRQGTSCGYGGGASGCVRERQAPAGDAGVLRDKDEPVAVRLAALQSLGAASLQRHRIRVLPR